MNLTSLEGYTPAIAPTHSEQQKTLHRIAGRTQVNEEPNIIDYDANYEPIYGEPYAADARLINNYCISALEPVQDDIAAAANTTEGESVEASELSANWFGSKLGLEYGDGKHWNELPFSTKAATSAHPPLSASPRATSSTSTLCS